jgi:hypothetical protein
MIRWISCCRNEPRIAPTPWSGCRPERLRGPRLAGVPTGVRVGVPVSLASLLCLWIGATSPTNAQTPPPRIVAAHYFADHWPKNFISAFRQDRVAADFARLQDDGFNTVILLVSWGDFQPVYDPCCTYDERAFDRLRFLVEAAARADLDVVLRLGYAWTFHPASPTVATRTHDLMNDPAARSAFVAFADRIAQSLQDHPHVLLSFMSWEDQWLHRISERAQRDFLDYLSLLPAGTTRPGAMPYPEPQGADAPLFHGYWDWLVIYRLFEPVRAVLPKLSFEVRVDKDPIISASGDALWWLPHRAMYRQPGDSPISIYWAPFWGAANQGETLSAVEATALLAALLSEVRDFSGDREVFIDQFNFVDNTVGHEQNASIAPAQLGAFLDQATCAMLANNVIGYGIWTSRDYRESPLHNPAFAYGLEGWRLNGRSDPTAEQQLIRKDGADLELLLMPRDELTQRIPLARGRPLGTLKPPVTVCIEATAAVNADIAVAVAAGAAGEPVRLHIAQGPSQQHCAVLPSPVEGSDQELRVSVIAGGPVTLSGVWLFDHIQYGGVYDEWGEAGPAREPLQRLNQQFQNTPKAWCDASGG